jgi:hypothetical protein
MWRMSFPGTFSGCRLPSGMSFSHLLAAAGLALLVALVINAARVRVRRRRAVRLKAVGRTRELDAAVTQAGSSRLVDQLRESRLRILLA